MNFCVSSFDIYFSLGISLPSPSSFVTISELFYSEVFETFVILSEFLLPIKSPVTSGVFWLALFEAVLNESVADCLAWSCLVSDCIYCLSFYLYFYQNFSNISSKRQKSIAFYKYSIFRLNWIVCHFLYSKL